MEDWKERDFEDGPDPAVSQEALGLTWLLGSFVELRAGQLAHSSTAAIWIAEGREGSSSQLQDW